MILIMKAISTSASKPKQDDHARPPSPSGFLVYFLAWCGYALSPGSVVFGPWISFEDYLLLLVGDQSTKVATTSVRFSPPLLLYDGWIIHADNILAFDRFLAAVK